MSQDENNEVGVIENTEVRVVNDKEAFESNLVSLAEAKELDVVNDINEFSSRIFYWHTHNMNQLVHAMNQPEYMPGDDAVIRVTISSNNVEMGAKDGQRFLHPKELEAFKAGIRYAYDQCNEMPFKFVPTDADNNVLPEYQEALDNAEPTETKA